MCYITSNYVIHVGNIVVNVYGSATVEEAQLVTLFGSELWAKFQQ